MYYEEYDIKEYEGMFIPDKLKPLIGRVSREEMRYRIQEEHFIFSYILRNGKPTTLIKKPRYF